MNNIVTDDFSEDRLNTNKPQVCIILKATQVIFKNKFSRFRFVRIEGHVWKRAALRLLLPTGFARSLNPREHLFVSWVGGAFGTTQFWCDMRMDDSFITKGKRVEVMC